MTITDVCGRWRAFDQSGPQLVARPGSNRVSSQALCVGDKIHDDGSPASSAVTAVAVLRAHAAIAAGPAQDHRCWRTRGCRAE